MIYILSPGRSGSGWLSTVFACLGLVTRHELYPVNTSPDVFAFTGWLWNQQGLIDLLNYRNKDGAKDTVIILDRPRAAIEKSMVGVLGREENWDQIFDNWEKLKDAVWNHGLTQILRSGHKVNYDDLFKPEFAVTLKHILSSQNHHIPMERIREVLDYMRNMKIVNKSVEQETRQSYGIVRN